MPPFHVYVKVSRLQKNSEERLEKCEDLLTKLLRWLQWTITGVELGEMDDLELSHIIIAITIGRNGDEQLQ